MKISRILVIGAMGLMIGGWGAPAARADFVHVPASEFNITPSDGMYMGGQMVYKAGTIGYLTAPVLLPDGAVIKNIRVFYYDNDAEYLQVSLVRRNQFTDDMVSLFQVQTQGATSGFRSSVDSTCSPAPSYRKVYNNTCQYYMRAYFGTTGSSLILYGISIEYE